MQKVVILFCTHKGFSLGPYASRYKAGVVFFGTQSFIFLGEYTCNFLLQMVYDVLVVDMIVCDMQV